MPHIMSIIYYVFVCWYVQSKDMNVNINGFFYNINYFTQRDY